MKGVFIVKTKKIRKFDLANFSATKAPLVILLCLSTIAIISSVVGIDPYYNITNILEYSMYDKADYIFSVSSTDFFWALLSGFVLGLHQFRFLNKKAFGLATFSFPKKRKDLFNSKVITPIIVISVVIILTKLITLLMNIKWHGPESELFSLFFADLFTCLKCFFVGFTATTICSIFCGRFIETLAASYSLLVLPSVIFGVIDTILSCFLYGYTSLNYRYDFLATLVNALNPAYDTSQQYTSILLSYEIYEKPTTPLVTSILWILFCTVALILAKKYFVTKYKVEKIGFKSINKTITFITSIAISLELAYSVTVYSALFSASPLTDIYGYSFESPALTLTILSITSVIFAYICNSIVITSIKITKEKLKLIAAPITLIAVTFLFAITGGFGYASRLPDAEKIESIEVSSTYNHIELFSTADPHAFDEMGYVSQTPITLTTQNDIEIGKAIHESAINNRSKETGDLVHFCYTLKNGTKVYRSYISVSAETSDKLLTLWKTDEADKTRRDYLFNNKPTDSSPYTIKSEAELEYNPITDEYVDFSASCFDYKYSTVLLYSKDSSCELLSSEINKETFEGLKEAIYKDMSELSAEEWYKPEKTYGFISFGYNDAYYDSFFDMSYYENEMADAETIIDEIGTVINVEEGTLPTDEEEMPITIDPETGEVVELDSWEDYDSGWTYSGDMTDSEQANIPVTSNMKHTIKYLRDLGYMDFFNLKGENKTKPVKAYIADTKDIMRWYASYEESSDKICNPSYFVGDTFVPESVIYSFEEDEYYYDDYYDEFSNSFFGRLLDKILGLSTNESPAPATEITDEEEIYSLLESSHLKYYTNGESKILFIEYDNYAYHMYLIPG